MSKGRGKFLFWGMLFGFLAGLFLAPRKGSELRQTTAKKVKDIRDNPNEIIQDTIEVVKTKVNDVINLHSEIGDMKICEEDIVISKTFYDEEGLK